MKKRGSITTIIGPMFSGKSTELQRLLNRMSVKKSLRKIVCVNSSRDTRYDNQGQSITHDKRTYPAISCYHLSELDVKDVDVIGVEEGHFFEDLYETTDMWADLGIHVIVAALNSTFQRKPFEQVSRLLANVDEIKWLTALCDNCESSACFSYRICNKNEEFLTGGADEYKPLCRSCYIEESK